MTYKIKQIQLKLFMFGNVKKLYKYVGQLILWLIINFNSFSELYY